MTDVMHLYNLVGEDSHLVAARNPVEAVGYFHAHLEGEEADPPRVLEIDPARWSDVRIRVEPEAPGRAELTNAAAEIGDPIHLREPFCIGSTLA